MRSERLSPRAVGMALVLAVVIALLAGCVISPRRDGSTPTPPPGPGTGKLYVTNEAANTILRFDNALAATGNLAPNATISGTQISSPEGIVIDTVNNRLYVTTLGGVLVYDQASTRAGHISADRAISGMSLPVDVALDRAHDLLYVADLVNIFVFSSASTATGAVTPVRTITPLSGGVGFVVAGMLLDTSGDRLYVLDSAGNAVNIYDGANGLTGSVNANRSLSGANTQLSSPRGAQLDSLARLVVANNNSGSITIYASAATVSGNTPPSVTLTSSALAGPFQIIVTSGNELYVADGVAGSVPIFSGINTASGTVSPARNLSGSNTTLSRTAGSATTARGIALDATR